MSLHRNMGKRNTMEGSMGKRIVGVLVLVGLAFLCVIGYQRYKEKQQLADGEIHCVGCMSPAEKAIFDRKNSGDDSDAASEQRSRAKADTPAGFPDPAPAAGMIPAQPTTTAGYGVGSTPVSAPSQDTIAPNPPNGVAFGGTGNYQWYRQGNLTWRVDTTTGRSCIVYATMEEWQKRIVMSHGCGHDA